MNYISSRANQPVLFFDISSLLEYVSVQERYSGIQRVVAMVLAELSAIVPPEQLYVSFILRGQEINQCVRFDQIGAEAIKDPLAIRQIFFSNSSPIPGLDAYAKQPIKYIFHRIRFDVFAKMNREKSFRRLGITPNDWQLIRQSKAQEDSRTTVRFEKFETVARPGSFLIALDSSWRDWHVQAFRLAKKSGIHIFTFVHDLIPIVQGHTTAGIMPTTFFKWLDGSRSYTRHYIANSEATSRDLHFFLKKRQDDKPISVLPLAQSKLEDVKRECNVANSVGALSGKIPELANILGVGEAVRSLIGSPFALCVGTIEARKNNWRLAAAWKYLIESGHVDIPRLVFAGRKGWHSENFFDLLNATGNLFGYATLIEGPSDRELEFLYRNCQFTLMPSIYEGWGLPVGEALSYGKTAVVSQTSSLPEVGLDLVEYCDPSSVKSIADAVLRLAGDSMRRTELENKIKSARLRTWREVAHGLLEIIV